MLIEPVNESQQLFLHELMKKNNIKWKTINEENVEDAALLKLMLQSNLNDKVSEEEILEILKEV